MNILKGSDLKPDNAFFGLFLGRSKSAKSTSACSWPDPLDIDFDGRVRGIDLRYTGHDYRFTRFMRPHGWVDVDNALDEMQMKILARQLDIPKTIVLDSLGGFTRMMVSESIDLQKGFIVGPKGAPRSATGADAKGLRMEGPNDYKYESNATQQLFDRLRTFATRYAINVIVTAHIIPKWGKESVEDNRPLEMQIAQPLERYTGPAEVIGEKLNVRDNLGETALTYFDEVYRFERREIRPGVVKHFVKFNSDMAASSLLSDVTGEIDITGKVFHQVWTELIQKHQKK